VMPIRRLRRTDDCRLDRSRLVKKSVKSREAKVDQKLTGCRANLRETATRLFEGMARALMGLDTFGDVSLDGDGASSRKRKRCATSWQKPCSLKRSGSTFSVGEHHVLTLRSPRPKWC
jgi:hypothetical protein